MSNFILYTTEDGKSQIQLRADQDTVWLTQLEIADLFNATKQNISLHLKNIFEDGEIETLATVKDSLTVQKEGNRELQKNAFTKKSATSSASALIMTKQTATPTNSSPPYRTNSSTLSLNKPPPNSSPSVLPRKTHTSDSSLGKEAKSASKTSQSPKTTSPKTK